MRLALQPELRSIVAPALLAVDDVTVLERDARMDAPIAESAARLRTATDLDDAIARVRTMYRRVGLDPTKTRPSSEALLRRLRRGEALPRVNAAVDICNWCSVESQVPYGLYDRDRIDGDAVALRLGVDGEGYAGIRKEHVNVGGRLTLADRQGPFGNPTSDSARTMVTPETRRLVVVIFAPADSPARAVAAVVAKTAERIQTFLGGVETVRLTT
jgi:DNA/RNA-binding domain of Phe-tRNA-synthetase-like protein